MGDGDVRTARARHSLKLFIINKVRLVSHIIDDLVLISLDQVFATVINLKEISKYLFDLKKNHYHHSEI